MRNLRKVAIDCMYKLDCIGVPFGEITAWEINTRAKSRWGQCCRKDGKYSININIDLLREENPLINLENTIIHELIHSCPDCMNHGAEWKKWVDVVNKAYPEYKIQRCVSNEEYSSMKYLRERESNYKYKVVCDSCKHVYRYKRMCHTIECCIEGNAKCACGGRKFNVFDNNGLMYETWRAK